MLYFSLLLSVVLYSFAFHAIDCDDVSLEIENIGNDVKQNFDYEGFKPTPITNPIVNPLVNSLPISTPVGYLKQIARPAQRHRPSLNQINYLVQNKNNPAPKVFRRARAVLTGGSGVTGLINLKQIKGGPVLIFGTIQGFPRQGKFGFHFHEYPVQADCESAGEHFNPFRSSHGGKDDFNKHAGDLGNIVAQYNGVSHVVLTSDSISLGNGANSVLGRSLVVHVNQDDLGTRPNRESAKTGNSGYRLACGTVALLSPVLTAENKFN